MGKRRRLVSLLLALMILMPVFSLAEEEQSPVTHTAMASVRLKVRWSPENDAPGGDSIPRGSRVYILEYGDPWCRVRTNRMEGYVKTQYLTDLAEADDEPVAGREAANGTVMYTARASVRLKVRWSPENDAPGGDSIPRDSVVNILEYGNPWCRVRTSRMEGYVKTQYLTDLAEADDEPVAVPGTAGEEETHLMRTARAGVRLKVRWSPENDAPGGDSIPRGSRVSILEYGDEWCRVRTSRMEGYVRTQYLTDLAVVDHEPAAAPARGEEAVQAEEPPSFTMNESNFEEKYYAHTVLNRVALYEEPRQDSARVRHIDIYSQVVVGEISGGWCFVRFRGADYGYIRTDHLFKWDRIDPYAGEIPGLEIWPNLVFVNRMVAIHDVETGEELFTVNPGAALSAGEKDAQGRYPVPFERVTGYVTEDEVACVMPVIPWEEAQPGDLISTMSTFFALGISTLQYQGRNWNIHMASDFLDGTVLQPGQAFNMNQTIGPYQQATGYKAAPIMSSRATSGYGGGTCQVNTTFYIATIQLPLLVTHRKVHAEVGMYYAKKGFDAAVGGGDINLTMVNTLPYAIRYLFMNSDGVLTCCIFRE